MAIVSLLLIIATVVEGGTSTTSPALISVEFDAIADLCSAESPSESIRSRSKMECVSACQSNAMSKSSSCSAVNYRPETRMCELFNEQPMNFTAQQRNCIYVQVRYFTRLLSALIPSALALARYGTVRYGIRYGTYLD